MLLLANIRFINKNLLLWNLVLRIFYNIICVIAFSFQLFRSFLSISMIFWVLACGCWMVLVKRSPFILRNVYAILGEVGSLPATTGTGVAPANEENDLEALAVANIDSSSAFAL